MTETPPFDTITHAYYLYNPAIAYFVLSGAFVAKYSFVNQKGHRTFLQIEL